VSGKRDVIPEKKFRIMYENKVTRMTGRWSSAVYFQNEADQLLACLREKKGKEFRFWLAPAN
jgi:hypothetical protein